MRIPCASGILVSFLALSPAGAAPSAKDAPRPVMPEVKRDASPVNDGKSPLVTSYADIVEPVQKAVVTISSTKTVSIPTNPLLKQLFGNQIPDRKQKEEGLGSGVIVSPDGYILTNNHVVEGADELTVTLSDERKFKARLIGTDDKTDVAVIKIDAKGLQVVTLADSDKLRVGDVVFAVGNPLGVGETVTMGIVSAKGRTIRILDDVEGYEDFIQTDAAINLGNSGGALVDAKGRLIGINSAIISPTRGSIGIGFAVPVNLASSVMRSLILTGTVSRGYLGIDTSQNLTADLAEQLGLPRDTKGLVVVDVAPDSPAAKGGLQNEDVILAIDGKPVASEQELRLAVAEMPPDSKIALKVVRDGKPLTLSVLLGAAPDTSSELVKGVTAVPLTPEARRKMGIDPRVNGLIITGVEANSPYADTLAENMVIMEINRSGVTDLASAKGLLHKGQNLVFVYFRRAPGFLVLNVR